MNIDELAQRHQYDYEGYVLADWYDAAFEFWTLQLNVLLQEEQPLPLVDRFVLRSLSLGLTDINDIGGVLGLEHAIVYQAMDRLNRSGYLLIVPARETHAERVTLTDKGHTVLKTLRFSQSIEDVFTICQDAVTGKFHKRRDLLTHRKVKGSGFFQLKPNIGSAASVDQLRIGEIRKIWDETQHEMPKYQRGKRLLNILSVEKSYPGFYSMRILQYVRELDGDVQVQVYDNAARSREHEEALRNMHNTGMNLLRMERRQEMSVANDKIEEFVTSKISSADIEAARRKQAEVDQLKHQIAQAEDQLSNSNIVVADDRQKEFISPDIEAELFALRAEVDRQKKELRKLKDGQSDVEVLSMLEHRPKMLEVLREAQIQVVIISPWLKSWAINSEFLKELESALKRGVEIIIGYGFEKQPDDDEKKLLQQLKKLGRKSQKWKLTLHRLQDSHAKIILWDHRSMIITSFNWLSFAGKPDWGNRVEFGTLIRKPDLVQQTWSELLKPLFDSSPVVS